MTPVAAEKLHPAQKRRLERFSADACADTHCHCLPGLDDGPATLEDAVTLCKALVDDGITTVIATPHQLGRFDGRNAAQQVRDAVAELNAVLTERGLALQILPGGDVRLDERIARLLHEDVILTAADRGRHLFLELPHDTYIDPLMLIRRLRELGVQAVVTHPERHAEVRRRPDVVRPWLASGAILQVTAGSLAGRFGAAAEDAAWLWMEQGLVSLVATDAHDAEARPPCLTHAIDAIASRLGRPVAAQLCLEHPARILDGAFIDPPLPPGPAGGRR